MGLAGATNYSGQDYLSHSLLSTLSTSLLTDFSSKEPTNMLILEGFNLFWTFSGWKRKKKICGVFYCLRLKLLFLFFSLRFLNLCLRYVVCGLCLCLWFVISVCICGSCALSEIYRHEFQQESKTFWFFFFLFVLCFFIFIFSKLDNLN